MRRSYTSLLIVFIITLFISCQGGKGNVSEEIRRIRYFSATIHNIENKYVTLADGNVWEANRLVIAVNLTEVFFVLEEALDVGYMYVSGTKLRVSRPGYGNFVWNYGTEAYYVETTNSNSVMNLSDGTTWIIALNEREKVLNWSPGDDVVITNDRDVIINPRNLEYIRVKELELN